MSDPTVVVDRPVVDGPLSPGTTVVAPRSPEEVAADSRRPLSSRTLDDRLSLGGSVVSSLALVWLLYYNVLPFSGRLGFVMCWFAAFIGLYGGVTALSQPRPIVVDRTASALIAGAAVTSFLALGSTIVFTFAHGWRAIVHLNFFTTDMAGVGPQDSLNHGGILHAIAGSMIEVAIAVTVALPLGISAAVYMTEVGGRFARFVRTVIEAMTALPDLVAGLFIYAVLIVAFGQSRTGLAASLAIAITMLPIIARSSEVVLRVVPGGLREASFALGAPQWRTVWRVVLPTARPGLGTALVLGIARGIGETAPVLITSGASTFFNADPTTNPMNSLPLFVYSAVRSGQPTYIIRGYGAACVLLTIVLVLFVFVRILARQPDSGR